MSQRKPALRGYVLAEALISAAIASLAGVLSVTLLIWSAEAIDRAQSSVGAMRVLSRLYEESRLLTPAALGRPASGMLGRYQWVRAPQPSLAEQSGLAVDPKLAYAPVPVRFFVRWTSAGRVEQRELAAVVRPGEREPGG